MNYIFSPNNGTNVDDDDDNGDDVYDSGNATTVVATERPLTLTGGSAQTHNGSCKQTKTDTLPASAQLKNMRCQTISRYRN